MTQQHADTDQLHVEVRRLLAAEIVKGLLLPLLPAIRQAFELHLSRKKPLPDLKPALVVLDLVVKLIRAGMLATAEDVEKLGNAFPELEGILDERNEPNAPRSIRPGGGKGHLDAQGREGAASS